MVIDYSLKQLFSKNYLPYLHRQVFKLAIEALIDCEMTEQLGFEKNQPQKGGRKNYRNGYTQKKVKSYSGEVELKLPRDRNGSFTPLIIKKHKRDITGIEAKLLSLFVESPPPHNTTEQLKDIYENEYSPQAIMSMTEVVQQKAREWQDRPLKRCYPLVYIDTIMINMFIDNSLQNVTVYAIVGITEDSNKECLGLYYIDNSSRWLAIMNSLIERGVKEIRLLCVDKQKELSETYQSVFSPLN